MKKVIYLSVIAVASIHAEELLEDISVNEEVPTQTVKEISSDEIKSADLAETLHKKVPSISLIRRSGIANDILLRGQKRDNINVTVDGAKIYGACPNRMDPPTSHVVTHIIDEVEVQEGPFDIEEFGALSGSVKIHTKKPTKGLHGDLSLNAGSFNYQKLSGTISGGTEKIKVLFTASTEKSDQYKDGDGNNFAEQIENYNPKTPFNYSEQNRNQEAYKKSTYMGKVFVDISSEQTLDFSYTANRSENILYPSSPMDAPFDDSDIMNLHYSLKNLSTYSKKLDLQVYNSKVDHPMDTKFRKAGAKNYSTHQLSSEITGIKVKNTLDAFGQNITYGVDGSRRNWDGSYRKTNVATGKVMQGIKSIDNVDTDNVGLFIKSKKNLDKIALEMGLRYDDTTISTDSKTQRDNDYNGFSANIFANYQANESTKYFAGLGKSNRVPDARELYFSKKMKDKPIKVIGNDKLKKTSNYELDLGVKQSYESGNLKLKAFYSKLKDYIYYNSSLAKNNFENIDATIYGLEVSGGYMPSDEIYLSAGLAYKKGKKDTQPTGQKNDNLSDITPLKLNLSTTYDYSENGMVELSLVAADKWDSIDRENGEQKLAGYAVLNLKTDYEFDNGIALSAGVDNLLDKTYANSNTYKDLTLITAGADDTMLINEAGRYFYLNAKYQF